MAAETAVVLVVEAGHQASIDDLVPTLRRLGLAQITVHRNLGVISGVTPGDLREQLAAVPGVASVQASQGYRLAPPDQEVQ